jgi:hypothetical protein
MEKRRSQQITPIYIFRTPVLGVLASTPVHHHISLSILPDHPQSLLDHNCNYRTITIMPLDDQNGGLVATSPASGATEQLANTSDVRSVRDGTDNTHSKASGVIRRVRFLEKVVPRSNSIRHDADCEESRRLDAVQPCKSTVTSKEAPVFDDEGSLDTLNGIESANDVDESMSLSDLLLFAAEAAADVDEERRQHFLWSCAPRTKQTSLESVAPR